MRCTPRGFASCAQSPPSAGEPPGGLAPRSSCRPARPPRTSPPTSGLWTPRRCRPLDRFTGVLFAALDVSSLTGAQRVRAARSTLVFSGAFGALAGDEPVPLHRVPASATLPRIGGLAAYWRKALAVSLAPRIEGAGLVVDLRSSDYAAMWQPAPSQAGRVVTVRVLEDRGDRLQAVSWSSKHGKGLLARELLRTDSARSPVRKFDDVAAAAGRIGYGVLPRATVTSAPGLRGELGPGLDLIVPG